MSLVIQPPPPDTNVSKEVVAEPPSVKGNLTLFLGYAPRIGKTTAMLKAALQRRQEGVDVFVVSVETRGDVETEALLAGLEVAPRLKAGYRGDAAGEIDFDAILARRPQVIVMDELAHVNSSGSRHPKRYQDVEELLGAGFDVYATLTIGQLESLRDVITQITGVSTVETIPDLLLDEASEVQVVDLQPASLLRRVREGEVTVKGQGDRAERQFFRQRNLIALREAEWFAIHVDTPSQPLHTPENREQLERTLMLAEELGAKATIVPGSSVVDTVLSMPAPTITRPSLSA